MLISKCHSDGPSAGPAEASGLPEAHGPPHGPPKVHGLRGHCTPLPPLSVALIAIIGSGAQLRESSLVSQVFWLSVHFSNWLRSQSIDVLGKDS